MRAARARRLQQRASSARLGASKPSLWRNFCSVHAPRRPISARAPQAAGSKQRVQIAPASLFPSASLVLALPDRPRIAHCPATLLTTPLRSLEIKSFPSHGAPFLSISIVPSARYISLSRGPAPAAQKEEQRATDSQSRADTCAEHSHPRLIASTAHREQLRRITTTTYLL